MGLLCPWKNARICPQRAVLALQSTADYFFKFELAGWLWEPTSDYNGCLEHFKLYIKKIVSNRHYYLYIYSWLPHSAE